PFSTNVPPQNNDPRANLPCVPSIPRLLTPVKFIAFDRLKCYRSKMFCSEDINQCDAVAMRSSHHAHRPFKNLFHHKSRLKKTAYAMTYAIMEVWLSNFLSLLLKNRLRNLPRVNNLQASSLESLFFLFWLSQAL